MTDKKELFLIVDDEPDMCWALAHILKENGFASKMALSGNEALTLVKQHRFKAVFLDAKLPDIEGLDLARRIHKINPTLPLVMISGYFYRNDGDVQQFLREGLISGFVAKPFFNDEIVKTVKDICKAPAGREGQGG